MRCFSSLRWRFNPRCHTTAKKHTDNGVAFDPTTCPEVDTDQVVAERQIGGQGIALLRQIDQVVAERQIGGQGIALLRQIADDIQYRRKDGQNELMIIKNI